MSVLSSAEPNHTVCITGASRGIGRSLALHFARENVYLMLFGRDAKRLELVASECRRRGAEVFASATDVTDFSAFSAAVDLGCQGRSIDLAIVNAGISNGIFEPLIPIEASLDIVKTNLLAAMHTISIMARQMRSRRKGHLVILLSLSSFLFSPGSHGYCASKAGLRAFVRSLRDPLKELGIAVTEVYPGIVETDMSKQLGLRLPFGISADRAAIAIARAVCRKRKTVFVPFSHFTLLCLAKAVMPIGLIRRELKQSGAEVYAD